MRIGKIFRRDKYKSLRKYYEIIANEFDKDFYELENLDVASEGWTSSSITLSTARRRDGARGPISIRTIISGITATRSARRSPSFIT